MTAYEKATAMDLIDSISGYTDLIRRRIDELRGLGISITDIHLDGCYKNTGCYADISTSDFKKIVEVCGNAAVKPWGVPSEEFKCIDLDEYTTIRGKG